MRSCVRQYLVTVKTNPEARSCLIKLKINQNVCFKIFWIKTVPQRCVEEFPRALLVDVLFALKRKSVTTIKKEGFPNITVNRKM